MTDKIHRTRKSDISKQRIFRALALGNAPFNLPANQDKSSGTEKKTLAVSCDPAQIIPASTTQALKTGCDSYRFSVPKGWECSASDNDICLTSTTVPAWIVIFPHTHDSIDEVDRYIQKESTDSYMQLKQQGDVQLLDATTIEVKFVGAIAGMPVRVNILGTLSPYGGGSYILAIIKFDLYNLDEFLDEVTDITNTIIKQMEYLKPDDRNLKIYLSGLYENQKGNRIILLSEGVFGRRCSSTYEGFTETIFGERVKAWGMASWSAVWGDWVIKGNTKNGAITAKYDDGSKEILAYQIVNEDKGRPWKIKFNGKTYIKQKSDSPSMQSMDLNLD